MLHVSLPEQWPAYASLALSLVALLLSLLSYRRAGPRVRARASAPRDWDVTDNSLALSVVVTNTGLASIQVANIQMALSYGGYKHLLPLIELTEKDRQHGPPLPITLEGSHQERWVFDARSSARRVIGDDPQKYVAKSITPAWFARTFAGVGLRALAPWNIWNTGVLVVVDLGNDTHVLTRPLWRVSWKLWVHFRKRRHTALG